MKRKNNLPRQTVYVTCNKCNDLIGSYGYKKHYNKCVGINKNLRNQREKVKLTNFNIKQINDEYLCLECDKKFSKMGIGTHYVSMHTERGKEINLLPNSRMKGKKSWNKNLTKESDSRVLITAEKFSKNYKEGKHKKTNLSHTDEFKANQSKLAKERGLGGVRQSKKIKYNGVYLGSTYELKVAQSLDENGIKWIVPKKINYVDPNGKKRTYSADFYLEEYNVYLDPKNDFLINNINPRLGFSDVEKIKLVENQNNIKVIILNNTQLSWDNIKNIISNI
jgi:hypothetical protein